MRKISSQQLAEFCLFAFPCYFTFYLIFIALMFWKTPIGDPALMLTALITLAMIIAAVILIKGQYLICIPMSALGAFIAAQDDQHFGGLFLCFGLYMVIHYLICGLYVYKNRGK